MTNLSQMRSSQRSELLRIAQRHGARNVRVFGSVARGQETPSSDVDFLVTWEPGRSLLDHARLVQELETFLGRRVHLGTERSLNEYVRERILAEAQEL